MRRLLLLLVFLFAVISCSAQTSSIVSGTTAAVPPLVRFSGTLANTQGTVGVIFALYTEQTGGAPLWLETQNVTPDAHGRYTVYLGVNHASGVPLDVFASAEARWLGVQPEGQAEQPRVQLVSVPYALKAAKATDADTLGGQPLSAFVLASNAGTTTASAATANAGSGVLALASPQVGLSPVYTSGSALPNYMAKFSTATDVEPSSVLYDSGSAVGIGTTAPQAVLHVVSPTAVAGMIDAYSGSSITSLGALPMVSRAARGTAGSPSAVKTNDYLGGLGARAYTGTTFTGGWRAAVLLRADQDWTDTAQGTNIAFGVTARDTAAQKQVMWLTSGGALGVGINTPDSLLTVAGPIHSTTGGFKFPDGSTQASAAANVASGSGLISNVTSGVATLGIDTSVLQSRVSGTCPTGAISQISQSGTVQCVSISASAPLFLGWVSYYTVDYAPNTGLVASRIITDQSITVTEVSTTANDSGVGTCTPALLRITNGTIYEDMPIKVGTARYDTATHALVFPGGSEIKILIAQTASCSLASYAPGSQSYLGGTVRYRLANSGEATSCPPNLALVNGSCVDLQSDVQNCGTAGKVCPGATNRLATCSGASCGLGDCISGATLNSGGQCTCPNGGIACSSSGSSIPYCASIQTDTNNCGACGHTCAIGQFCQLGTCQSCSSGQTACVGSTTTCVYLQTDPNNCGSCNNSCQSTLYNGVANGCSAGSCSYTCASGLTLCTSSNSSASCVSTSTDPNNCGACGNVCGSGQFCQAGTCKGCSSGQTTCSVYSSATSTWNLACVNPQTDASNCGGCNNACQTSVSNGTANGCAAGKCSYTCNSGLTLCTAVSGSGYYSSCLNTLTDANNCGSCSNVCPTGQICQAGKCQACAAGQTACGGLCANTQTDFYNCGACGIACSSSVNNGTSTGCSGGHCGATCTSGNTAYTIPSAPYVLCTNLLTDANNCGLLGYVCAGGQICQAGTCQACAAGQTVCGGQCVNTQTDTNNCGACARNCGGSQLVCQGGNCQACSAGLTNCSNNCVNMQTDSANCGSCGFACGSSKVCTAGACH